jgi:hypothetical protein
MSDRLVLWLVVFCILLTGLLCCKQSLIKSFVLSIFIVAFNHILILNLT